MKRLLALLALMLLGVTPLAAQDRIASDQGKPDAKFKRGLTPTPRHKIAEAISTGKATVFRPTISAPDKVAWKPDKLSKWGNDRYGDCVTAEQGFAIGGYSAGVRGPGKGIFITEQAIISWASSHGVLNGANLLDVIQMMQKDGIKDDAGNLWKDGIPSVVNTSNEATLQAALAKGPVSTSIAADCLPNGAGNTDGWYSFSRINDTRTDHCVPILGYGSPEFVFGLLGKPVPANAPSTVYLLGTWGTIGVVSYQWMLGTVDEQWLRTPTVVGIDPLPPDPVGLTITPASASLAPGATQQFSATLIPAGQDSVVWSASGGGITSSGLYTAPSQVGAYTVKATLLSNSAKFVTAAVTVSATPGPTPGTVVGSFTVKTPGDFDIVPKGSTNIPSGFEIAPVGSKAKADKWDALMQIIGKTDEPKQIPEAFQLKPKEPEKAPPIEEPPATYDDLRARAISDGKPLVVAVGCQAPRGPWYAIQLGVPWDGYRERCVILATPEAGDLYQRKVYPPGVTAQTVSLTLSK